MSNYKSKSNYSYQVDEHGNAHHIRRTRNGPDPKVTVRRTKTTIIPDEVKPSNAEGVVRNIPVGLTSKTEEQKPKLVICEVCKQAFAERGLNQHKKLKHGAQVHTEVSKFPKSVAKTPPPSERHTNTPIAKSGHKLSTQTGPSKSKSNEAFRQSSDEPRDGSKHLGHLRRENGRFGSFPLHDDYGEESEA